MVTKLSKLVRSVKYFLIKTSFHNREGIEEVYSFLNGAYELKDGDIETCSIINMNIIVKK